jgi:hypothetical protein
MPDTRAICAISSLESSRASTAREKPSSLASSSPEGAVTAAWVEACSWISGHAARDDAGDTQILHQQGVHPRRRRFPHRLTQRGKLPVEHQGVERLVNLYPPDMAILDGAAKGRGIEILRVGPGVEALPAHIHGVAAAFHRRRQGFLPAGRRQYFHFVHRLGSWR